MNGQNLTTFCIHIIIDKIYIGIVNRHFFCKFATELRPLIDVRIQFLFNILRMNGQNLTKFCMHIIIDKIYVGIVNRHFFCKFATELLDLPCLSCCHSVNLYLCNSVILSFCHNSVFLNILRMNG